MTEAQLGSGAVLEAREYLKSVTEGMPSAFRGPYAAQIAGLYDRIVNGAAFRYEAEKDPLQALEDAAFRQYARRLNEAARDGGEAEPWHT